MYVCQGSYLMNEDRLADVTPNAINKSMANSVSPQPKRSNGARKSTVGNAVVNLNVGGISYSTTIDVIANDTTSLLHEWFVDPNNRNALLKDVEGRYFIDRDGQLFRFILDFLRSGVLILPDNFQEKRRLMHEAEYYRINGIVKLLHAQMLGSLNQGVSSMNPSFAKSNGFITIGYQGTFSFGGRQGMSDVSFRKVNRILVCGRVSLCREVFGDSLNEGRDPDRGDSESRYTVRFYLKHTFLEQAFDTLSDAGFSLLSSCASGTSGGAPTEEDRWAHYNEFIFYRP